MKNNMKWDLSDLYSGIDDENIKKDLDTYKRLNLELEKEYKGKLSEISSENLYNAIKKYEEMTVLAHQIGGFAFLNMCTQMENSSATGFYQNTIEALTNNGTPSIFFTLEINQISDVDLEKHLKDEKIAKFSPWFERTRLYKKYELSQEVETIFAQKSITSGSAWSRFYDEHCSGLKYIVDGKEYNDAQISGLTQSKDRETRLKAGEQINRINKENSATFTFIYNMIIKDQEISDEKRGFKNPISSRNLANNVEGEVVDCLVSSVKENYKNISHRFYKLKAKWLGLEKISYWDRNAPLAFEDNSKYSWEEAVKIVLDSYQNFSPKLHSLATDFFEKSWIDIEPKQGKRGGAFAHPVSSAAHPYLFLNFEGKMRDILTLSHELGHGCHMRLSTKQGELNDDTPLTLAEVASVFAESLTFRKLIDEITDDKARLCLIANKVNDMINTAIRQIAFHSFEEKAHAMRRKGELSSDDLVQIWREEMKQSLGETVEVDENCEHIWSQISHFFGSPFYVYAYSFADCVVNSLYSVYSQGNVENFEDKYLTLLSETGVKKYDELLKPFGLDAKNQNFWNQGLAVISSYIDELEKLDKKLGL